MSTVEPSGIVSESDRAAKALWVWLSVACVALGVFVYGAVFIPISAGLQATLEINRHMASFEMWRRAAILVMPVIGIALDRSVAVRRLPLLLAASAALLFAVRVLGAVGGYAAVALAQAMTLACLSVIGAAGGALLLCCARTPLLRSATPACAAMGIVLVPLGCVYLSRFAWEGGFSGRGFAIGPAGAVILTMVALSLWAWRLKWVPECSGRMEPAPSPWGGSAFALLCASAGLLWFSHSLRHWTGPVVRGHDAGWLTAFAIVVGRTSLMSSVLSIAIFVIARRLYGRAGGIVASTLGIGASGALLFLASSSSMLALWGWVSSACFIWLAVVDLAATLANDTALGGSFGLLLLISRLSELVPWLSHPRAMSSAFSAGLSLGTDLLGLAALGCAGWLALRSLERHSAPTEASERSVG